MNNTRNGQHRYVGYRVYNAQKSIAKCLEVALKPYDITPGQWNLINQLDRQGNLSQKELANHTRKEQATITRYLDKLESRGLIKREADPHDRRAHLITLTSKARDLLAQTESAANEASECLTVGISQANMDLFLDVLQAVHENADHFIEKHS